MTDDIPDPRAIKTRAAARDFFLAGGAVLRILCLKGDAWIWVIADTDIPMRDIPLKDCIEKGICMVGSNDIDGVPKSYVRNPEWTPPAPKKSRRAGVDLIQS